MEPQESAVSRSATAVGIAVIWAEFDWGEDIYRARQTVTEKLSRVAWFSPAGGRPTVSGSHFFDHGRNSVPRY